MTVALNDTQHNITQRDILLPFRRNVKREKEKVYFIQPFLYYNEFDTSIMLHSEVKYYKHTHTHICIYICSMCACLCIYRRG